MHVMAMNFFILFWQFEKFNAGHCCFFSSLFAIQWSSTHTQQWKWKFITSNNFCCIIINSFLRIFWKHFYFFAVTNLNYLKKFTSGRCLYLFIDCFLNENKYSNSQRVVEIIFDFDIWNQVKKKQYSKIVHFGYSFSVCSKGGGGGVENLKIFENFIDWMKKKEFPDVSTKILNFFQTLWLYFYLVSWK